MEFLAEATFFAWKLYQLLALDFIAINYYWPYILCIAMCCSSLPSSQQKSAIVACSLIAVLAAVFSVLASQSLISYRYLFLSSGITLIFCSIAVPITKIDAPKAHDYSIVWRLLLVALASIAVRSGPNFVVLAQHGIAQKGYETVHLVVVAISTAIFTLAMTLLIMSIERLLPTTMKCFLTSSIALNGVLLAADEPDLKSWVDTWAAGQGISPSSIVGAVAFSVMILVLIGKRLLTSVPPNRSWDKSAFYSGLKAVSLQRHTGQWALVCAVCYLLLPRPEEAMYDVFSDLAISGFLFLFPLYLIAIPIAQRQRNRRLAEAYSLSGGLSSRYYLYLRSFDLAHAPIWRRAVRSIFIWYLIFFGRIEFEEEVSEALYQHGPLIAIGAVSYTHLTLPTIYSV